MAKALAAVVLQPGICGRLRKAGITEEGAVVWQEIIAVVLPFDGMVTINEDVQVVSDGRPP